MGAAESRSGDVICRRLHVLNHCGVWEQVSEALYRDCVIPRGSRYVRSDSLHLFVMPRGERPDDATSEIDVRRSRATGAMDLKRPSRVLGLANEGTSLLIGRWLFGEVGRVGTDAPETKRRWHASMARADRAVRGQPTVRPSECFDRRAGVLQTLAKQVGRYPQGFRGLRTREVQNLAEYVRETMRPIETLEHAEGATDLHFLDEKGSLGIGWPIRRKALDQVVGEPLKVQVHVLDGTLLHIKNEGDGDTEDPRLEFAAEIDCASRVPPRTRISCVASSASSRFHNMRSARP